MKAITLKKNGGSENLIVAEISTPQIEAHEVLVKVKSVAINPVDVFVRQSEQALKSILQPKNGEDTFILGWDVSGEVVEVGENVTNFKAGDEVFGMVNFKGHGKAYAEYVAAPTNHLALKPANISHDEAAAATLAALTAWQALVTHGKIKKGEKVLIHSAAGGVGHYAIQIAKHFGAYVIATASAENKDFVLGLGANEFIDYKKDQFENKVNDADLVLDSIDTSHLLRSLDAVKQGGRVISILGFFEDAHAEKASQKGVFTERVLVQSSAEDMKQIADLLGSGAIKSHIFATYPFHDLPKAHQQVETRRTKGKVVVQLN